MYKFLRNIRKTVVYNLIEIENFSTFRICNAAQKFTTQLIPEVEAKLEAEEIKHRKHPGIRKFPAVSLPDWLLEAVSNLFAGYHDTEENVVMDTAQKLKDYLYHRRLPIEQSEINLRTLHVLEKAKIDIDALSQDEKATKKCMDFVKYTLKGELLRWRPVEYTYHTALAYLVARLAANYACVSHVFQEVQKVVPSFKPTSCFDFGSGVGAATWAAHTHFKESIKEYFCVDTSAEMNSICDLLLKGGKSDEDKPIIENVLFRQFLPASSKRKYDLVVSAFSFMELPSLSDRIRVIDILWQKTNDMLVLVESGGKAGFSSILEARDYILKIESEGEYTHTTGAHVVAPCQHELDCPLISCIKESKQIPCQFSVNYYSPYPKQNEKVQKKDLYTYVVLRRGKRGNDLISWPRIVKPILKSAQKVYCRLCCHDGSLHELILTRKRHGRHAYRCARVSSRGDLYPGYVFPNVSKDNINDKDDIENFKDDIENFDDDNEGVNDVENSKDDNEGANNVENFDDDNEGVNDVENSKDDNEGANNVESKSCS